jgi:hypothetical protein
MIIRSHPYVIFRAIPIITQAQGIQVRREIEDKVSIVPDSFFVQIEDLIRLIGDDEHRRSEMIQAPLSHAVEFFQSEIDGMRACFEDNFEIVVVVVSHVQSPPHFNWNRTASPTFSK